MLWNIFFWALLYFYLFPVPGTMVPFGNRNYDRSPVCLGKIMHVKSAKWGGIGIL